MHSIEVHDLECFRGSLCVILRAWGRGEEGRELPNVAATLNTPLLTRAENNFYEACLSVLLGLLEVLFKVHCF